MGTYQFGLTGCWGSRTATYGEVTSPTFSPDDFRKLDTIPTRVPLISIILFRHRNTEFLTPYYAVKVTVASQTQTRSPVISYRTAVKLFHRFISSSPIKPENSSRPSVPKCLRDHSFSVNSNFSDTHRSQDDYTCWTNSDEIMPGQHNDRFLYALHKNMQRKYDSRDIHGAWTVSSDLYAVWACTSFVSVELFADCINESGTLQWYCSADDQDREFGAIGHWMSVETEVEGAGGNPPFDPTFISTVLQEFERGVRRQEPYCRCILLPLGSRYGVLDHVNNICNEGILLVSIGGGALPFRSQLELLSLDERKPKPYGYQEVGLFIWRNRQYLLKYPVPMDVECVYMRWVSRALLNPFNGRVHLDAFNRAFPRELRSAKCVAEHFPV